MTNFPTKDDIQGYILEQAQPVNKRDIAKAFGIKGQDARVALKNILKQLEDEGAVEKDKSKSYKAPEALPAVTVVEVTEINDQGEVLAKPTKWTGNAPAPLVFIYLKKSSTKSPRVGDRILTRLNRISDAEYDGHPIKFLGDAKQGRMIGIFKSNKDGSGTFYPADKKERNTYFIPKNENKGAKAGQLVTAEAQPAKRAHGNKKEARILELLGDQNDPKLTSLIAIHTHGLPFEFPDIVEADAEKLGVPALDKREDMRHIPLVTIDGADARDFDDAVFAEKLPAKDGGGFHLIVAIADVSFYVRPGSPLDKEAYMRGNSTYFPDRVVPMLPEALSNDVCSLRPNEDRASLAVHMWIDDQGHLQKYKFTRALIKSFARLTYEQVQAARDGVTDAVTEPLVDDVIAPLYQAFAILDEARQRRGALELDLPERQVKINDQGRIEEISVRQRLDSHKLIEEFMILANVAAAQALEDKKRPCIYRVHDRPDGSRLDDARQFLTQLGLSFPKGQVIKPKNINAVLEQAKNTDYSEMVSTLVLRSQAQAIYSPDNQGHFGLGLRHYAHFTSPIRRYADLIVHRLLVDAYGLGPGQYKPEELAYLEQAAEHISETERRSMVAERDAKDRFTAQFLEDKIGTELTGRINGVSKFGLFVTLDHSGADGIVPMRSLPDDFYIHDEKEHALIGRNTGRLYRLCAPITVRLVEADSLRGSTVLELVDKNGAELPGFTPKTIRRPKGIRGGKKFKKHKHKTPHKHKKKNKHKSSRSHKPKSGQE